MQSVAEHKEYFSDFSAGHLRRLPKEALKKHDAVMTYFLGLTRRRLFDKEIQQFIAQGWIDSLHTYGDFSKATETLSFRRAYARRGARVLKSMNKKRIGGKIEVWIDHGNQRNIQNFGKQRPYMMGDVIGASGYHADLTRSAGIRFVWTSEQRQGFGEKQVSTDFLGRDGTRFWGFRRFTPNWHVDRLHLQLSALNLRRLVLEGNRVIIAQHFGALSDGGVAEHGLPDSAIQAFELLDSYSDQILICRTSRLLDYEVAHQGLIWSFDGLANRIIIHGIDDPLARRFNPTEEALRGISFAGANEKTTVMLEHGGLLKTRFYEELGVIVIPWFEQ
jgi:hypothetical protein